MTKLDETRGEGGERLRVLTKREEDAVLEVGADHLLLHASPGFQDLLGFSESEIIGKDFFDLVHPEERDEVRALHEQGLAEGCPVELLARFRRRDDFWSWLELGGRGYTDASGDLRGAFVCRDVNERMRAVQTIAAQRAAESDIGELSRRFNALGSDELDAAIEESLETAARIAGADRSYLISLVGDGEAPFRTFAWQAEGIAPRDYRFGRRERKRHAWVYEQLMEGKLVCVPRIADLPPEEGSLAEDFRTVGIQSYLAIPVRSSGRLLGILGFQSICREREWSEREIALLCLFAELLTSSLRRQRAENALRNSEERFRALAENAGDGIVEIAADGRYLYTNPGFSSMLGRESGELLGVDCFEHVHPDDREGMRERFERLLGPNPDGPLLYRALRSDGSVRWHEATVCNYSDASAQMRGAAVVRDVTERERAHAGEQRRFQLEQRIGEIARRLLALAPQEIDEGIQESLGDLATVSEADRNWLISLDVPGSGPNGLRVFAWRRPGLEGIEGPSEGDRPEHFPWIAKRVSEGELIHIRSADELPDEAASEREMMRARGVRSALLIPLFSGASAIGFLGFARLSEEKSWSDDDIALLRLAGEIFASALRRLHAEQALRESRSQLLQAQKMEAVGTLAGGIAHDFNNQLSVILGNARFLGSSVEGDEDLRESLGDLERAGEHCARLTHSLLAFSRRSPAEPRSLDLGHVMSEARELLQPLIPSSIDFEIECQCESDWVVADPTHLQQVVVNLAINARDAMPEGGKLSITTARREVDAADATRLGLERGGEYVELAVSDTGVGMDPLTAERVFEPFFTTKEHGKGTGLGLAVVYGIVRDREGALSLESTLGEGTTVRALLPRATEQVQESTPEETAPEPVGRATVLLVEDEERVRRLVRRMLKQQGYEVLEARDGVEALELSGAHTEPIHALVTDIVMPRMGGIELARRMRDARPEIQVLFHSGHSEERATLPGARFLQKPFSQDDLVATLAELLRQPGISALN